MSGSRSGASGRRRPGRGRKPRLLLARLLLARILLAWLLLGAVLCCAPVAAATVEDRLRQLADQSETPLRFEETRESGLLAEPITVRGRLIYDPVTEQLTKQVESPRPARLSVTETHLVAQVGDGRLRRLPLDRRPDLAALLVAVRALLAGQVDAVEARFETSLETHEDTGEWVLALRPRDARLAEDLRLLEVLGKGDRVHTLQATLDREVQRMTILPPEPVAPAEPVEPAAPAKDDAR